MEIKTFNSFGYEGSIITVEADLRSGVPSVDIVGLADSCVKESIARIRSAFLNQEFDFPSERVLISLSPADTRKEGAGFDLAIASAVYAVQNGLNESESVLVMGELELSGKVRWCRGVNAALEDAVSAGIKYAVVPSCSDLKIPEGIKVARVENFRGAIEALKDLASSVFEAGTEETDSEIKFSEIDEDSERQFNELKLRGLKFAMAAAVAGHHGIIAIGAPGCGKSTTLQNIKYLLPLLTSEEKKSVTRIYSLAGIPELAGNEERPFRMPHQTASIEGMCGGGINCRPGEISLAHNGVLFLDEAAEFRSSVLQMLRVPLETKNITLSRAGRTTTYPADFQLVMATNPCPCGNFGSKDKICLCSAKSVEMYWHKFSAPLLDRVAIRFNCGAVTEGPCYNLRELRDMIYTAWHKQYKRQGKLNNNLNAAEVAEFIKLSNEAEKNLELAVQKYNLSPRASLNVKKLAMTLSDMQGQDEVYYEAMRLALSYTIPLSGLN